MRRQSFKQRLIEAVENRLWELEAPGPKAAERYLGETIQLQTARRTLNNKGSGPLPHYFYDLGRELDVHPWQ